jgi:putative oxygen-independent coproporphyrinogen III oxidase
VSPEPLPLALYVHMPWCVRKCPYCDFNSHARPAAGIPEHAYVAALLDDLEFAARDCAGRALVSIFFGGGTPSLFSAGSIESILRRATTLFDPAEEFEVTLEANPGTVERGRFAEYRDAGVNRVSLGAQSFDAGQLAALGRIHSRDETINAASELHAAGLHNFNLDLMYGLPRQTIAEALADVDLALKLEPAHVSHYQLTLEPGTAFERRPPTLPDDETSFGMQVACQSRLAEAGFRQYEVSAYARQGRTCRHNLNYWSFGDYLGIGAGAHGKWSDPGSGLVRRAARVKQPGRYLAARSPDDRIAETRTLSSQDLSFEFCLNALRLVEGFDTALFEARTGLSLTAIEPELAEAISRGLLLHGPGDRWQPTPLGRQFLNDLQAIFLAPVRTEGRDLARPGLALPARIG